MANPTSIKWANVEKLEKEINSRFMNNPDFNSRDLVVLAEVSEYSLVPIESAIDENGRFHVMNDPTLIGYNLYMGSRKQFIHEQYSIEETSIRIGLSKKFRSAWNENKFVVFRNGYLVNHGNLAFMMPGFANDYLKKFIYSTVEFQKGDVVDVFYIENGDDFNAIPISRDVYIGAIKHQATRSNERLIFIPYPNENYPKNEHSFFIFNEDGEYLDNRIDYIVSEDGKYVTLSEEQALRRARVDYIVFAFPQLPTDPGVSTGFESDEITDLDSGNALFRYAFSIAVEKEDHSGIVRFSPLFNGFRLTKKTFLLFGNGTWISPQRYDVYSNDAIIFNNDMDRVASATTKYTMIIFDDTTNHDEYRIPGEYKLSLLTVTKEDQREFTTPVLNDRYRSMLVFRGSLLLDSNDYTYDEDKRLLTILNDDRLLSIGRSYYVVWLNALINNTNRERSFLQFNFDCNPQAQRGTALPRELLYQELNEAYLLLFLNGRLLRRSEYDIIDNRIYLNERLVLDDNDNLISLAGHRYYAVYLESLYTGRIALIDEDEAKEYQKQWKKMDEDEIGGAVFKHYESLEWSEKREAGVVKFYPAFGSYHLAKKHMMLFGNGIYIHPDRYDLYDNGTIIFNNDQDRKHAQWAKYDMLVLDDEESDERYAPSSLIVKRVVATEEKQSRFEIPEVGSRYRSFLVFKGSLLMNKNYRYTIEDDEKHVTILNDFDYVEKGKSLTFVFLDAFARSNQEVQFLQFYFRCNPSGTTKLPVNLLNENFSLEEMALFLNGRYLDSSQYLIKNGYLYLDGYLLKGDFDHYVFTVVYLITMLTDLKEYNYPLPVKPAFPVRPIDDIGNAYFEFSHSEDREAKGKTTGNSGIVKFEPEFKGYSMVKTNFLLFGNGTWISPDRFELYDNDTVIFTNETDKHYAHITRYSMAIFNDLTKREVGYAPTYFEVVKVTIEEDNQRFIRIPKMNPDYLSFIVFRGTLLMGISNTNRYRLDFDEGIMEILHEEDYLKKGRTLSFVFLNAATTSNHRTIFLQESFKLDRNAGTLVPSSVYNEESFTEKHMLLFLNGAYLNNDVYEVRDNRLYVDEALMETEGEKWITAVHIISLRAEDYDEELTVEVRKPEGDANGFMLDYSYSMVDQDEDRGYVSFLPIFTDYELTKRNFLLFSRGLWIHPNRYEVYTNFIVRFIEDLDKNAASMPITMAILNEATKEEGYKPVGFTIRTVLATQEGQRLFKIPREYKSTFIVFLGSLLLPISNENRVFIDEEKGTLFLMDERDAVAKGRGLYFIFVNEDSSLNDRRYPLFLEETFDAVPDPRIGTPIPSDWYTETEFNERFMMLFVGGRFIPPSYYEIRDHKIYPEIDLDDIETEDVIKKYQYTAVYLASFIQEGIEKETHPWDPKPIVDEGTEYRGMDELPKSDVTPISGLRFDCRTSTIQPIVDDERKGWVQFLDRYDGYTLEKENFLLFGNSTWIDPVRYDIINNATILFHEVEDQDHSQWSHYTMVIFSNPDAIEEYGDHYVKTEYKVVRIKGTHGGEHAFELPTLESEWASWIVFRNGLIVPITDESRFRWDDYNHKFEILEEKEYLKKGDELVFIYLKATSNSDQEVAWTQVSFPCTGYETILPETVILYQNQRYDKRRVLLFLNGTHVNNDRFSIKDNKVYLKEGAYLVDDTHLYTLVYLTTANSEEEDTTEANVINETYEEGLDDIIFEERYATPTIAGVIDVKDSKGPNHLIFEKAYFSAISYRGIRGLIKFEPTFKGYLLQNGHFLLFSNGYFVDPSRYELYDQNMVLLNNVVDKEESPYNDYTMYIIGDSDSYTNGFVPPKWIVRSETVQSSRQSSFDIPIMDHEESRSLIVYRDSHLLHGYKLDWNNGKLILNDITEPLKEGETLYFVFLESCKTQEGKYPYLYQESFPASTAGSTRLPDRLRGIENTKHMLFLGGRLLKLTEYLIENGQVYLGLDVEDVANKQFTVVTLYERDELESGIVRR